MTSSTRTPSGLIVQPINSAVAHRAVLVSEFASRASATLESLRSGHSIAVSERVILASVEGDFDRAASPEFAARQHRSFGRPGQEASEFAPRWIRRVNAGSGAIAELRFKGMERSKPFIELSQLGRDAEQYLPDIVSAAVTAYAAFNVARARVWWGTAHAQRALPSTELTVEADLHVLVGSLRKLQRATRGSESKVQLQAIHDAEAAYPRYAELYRQFAIECPKVAEELHCSSLEEFNALVKDGFTYNAFVDGQWAGIVAARREAFFGAAGFVVSEEFLQPEFRGRGLGVPLQRALILELPNAEDELLWGTIHDSNKPSLSTAARCGRTPVGAHYWVEAAPIRP